MTIECKAKDFMTECINCDNYWRDLCVCVNTDTTGSTNKGGK